MERDTSLASRASGSRRCARHATTEHGSRQRGSVVFIALFSTLVISYLAHRLVMTAMAYGSLAKTLDSGIQHQQSMRLGLQRPASPLRGCTIQSLPHSSGGEQPWYICSTGSSTFAANQAVSPPSGRIDYNTIFAKASQCTFARRSEALTIFTSPRAAMTCVLPPTLERDIITTDNIEGETILVSPPSTLGVITIATVGSLKVSSSLTVSTSALIIAGGDTSIARIASNSSSPITVTIVSAHGDIQVGSLDGDVSLLALGRRLIVAPPGPPTTRFILPPFIPLPFAGIRPVGSW